MNVKYYTPIDLVPMDSRFILQLKAELEDFLCSITWDGILRVIIDSPVQPATSDEYLYVKCEPSTKTPFFFRVMGWTYRN